MLKRLHYLATCFILGVGLVAGGCAAEDGSDEPGDEPPPGFVRYRTAPIELAPGESDLWAQWVAAPVDRDLDVLEVRGTQSAGGHHALMYSTVDPQPPGTTRPWQATDQLATRFLGGIGGPTGDPIELPEGVVFRVPAGQGLVVQTHYINTSDEPIVVESVLDVKFADADDAHLVASMFSVTSLAIDVQPGGETRLDVDCVLDEDVELVMWANHMHDYGVRVETTATVGEGDQQMLKSDPAWVYEWASNPNFDLRQPSEPLRLTAGTRLDTRCTWRNDGSKKINFPDEMCVFFAFHLGDRDKTCVDGSWMN